MLKVINICKSYGPFTVLDDISFYPDKEARIGLVGANGSGKSTLLKIISGIETADSGSIATGPGETIGYLPQSLLSLAGKTTGEFIVEATGEAGRLEARMRALENDMNSANNGNLDDLVNLYSEVTRRFEELGNYELDSRTGAVMEGLGIGHIEKTRPVETLSGGEKTRLGLATLLLESPDILLLDEPTNNLDIAYLGWLENYLRGYRGAVIMASHDRRFLNEVADWIFEIDEHTHRLTGYRGNYDDFKACKDREKAKWEENYRRQQEEIKELQRSISTTAAEGKRHRKSRDGDKFIAHFKGERKQADTTRTIRSAREQLARITDDPIPKPPKPLRFKVSFTSGQVRSAEVIRATNLGKCFDGRPVLHNISFSLGSKSRVFITGPNGSGKTTLLRLLSGRDNPDSGSVTTAPGIRPGCLPQEPYFPESRATILEHYRRGLAGREEDFIFGLVTCGLFRYDEINKTLGEISLGQQRKLEIARLIALEPNVLLLDEPTNHLSLDTLESFETAISEFPGPVLAVSHDRQFIEHFGGELWELIDGQIIKGGHK